MKKILFILFLLPLSLLAQQDKAALEKEARQLVREGNELYNQLKFADAEVKYKKALEKNPEYEIANYNLGNALSLQNRTKEAIPQFELVAKTTKDKYMRASTMHNIGNAHYQDKEYQKAVDSYKHSLRANPKDDETRYNLALAQKMLKDQQNKDKDKDKKDNKDNKDNKKDKDKEKDKDKKDGDDKKDEDKKDDEKKDDEDKKDPNKDKKDEKKEQKPQPGKLSPQQIKQLLEAMNNEEQKTQKKMNAKKERGKKIKQEKDW